MRILTQKIHAWLFRLIITNTPPVQAASYPSDIVITSKIGHKYVHMYLASIKSFLLLSKLSIPVSIVDDGSLEEADVLLLKKHVTNICIISRAMANKLMQQTLRKHPWCLRYYRETHSNLYTHNTTVFELALLSKCKRFIALDADVIFYDIPHEIIQWVSKPKHTTLSMSFNDIYAKTELRWGRLLLRALARRWNSAIPERFNDGILCGYSDVYDPNKLNYYIKKYIYDFSLQTTWLSIIVLHSAIYTKSRSRYINKLIFLNNNRYVVATNNNIYIHKHPLRYTAIHYISDYKNKYLQTGFYKLILSLRLYRGAH